MPFNLKIIVFLIASGFFVWLSRGSIRIRRSHGFYRLFAWESILMLVLLNIDYWFDNWLCMRQITSWILLAFSIYPVMHGSLALHRSGKPDKVRADSSLIGIERTTVLVTSGIYRHIRHPIYSSVVIGVWGVVLKKVSAASIILALVSIILITITAKIEESENIQYFGDEYRKYIERTKMFIPYIF